MNKIERIVVLLSFAFALTFGVTQGVFAMHIYEGFLPVTHCVAWGVLCVPFLVMGFISMKNIISKHRKAIILLAMVGAYAFVLSSLKIPSVTGSSSHPTGTGLGAVLFGPSIMSVLGIIVLLFQAILLAHGGLTTLGANTFSMAIAGPILSYLIFVICKKIKINKLVAVFLACALGDLFTYCITSIQLALAHSGSDGVITAIFKFMSIFAVTQIPLAIIEGIVSVIVIMGLEAYAKPELEETKYMEV